MGTAGAGHADLMTAAPAGAALLARLEAEARRPAHQLWSAPVDVDADTVARAAAALAGRPLERLLVSAIDAGEGLAGPWAVGAPLDTAHALRLAPQRRALAVAVVDRLAEVWAAPLDLDAQVWFADRGLAEWGAGFGPLGSARPPTPAWVTATWSGGLWTATNPADVVAQQLVVAWEMYHVPVTRWRLRPEPWSRVYEVRTAEDWATLASDHPLARRERPGSSWEVPGVNQASPGLGALLDLPGQRAARRSMRYFVEPDWDSVAEEWDAVHLPWGGFLLAEGTVTDLGDGDVAMLRNWCGERTLWLNPVLDVAEALPAVPNPGVWEEPPDGHRDGPERRVEDREVLRFVLGR